MTAPAVSIVLPTYNGSKYLAGAVASIRAQSFQDWELILVDDCSKDCTPELIEHLAGQDPRIRPSRNPVNQRLPKSLNIGFAQSRGELLTWTSDDNEYRPDALAAMVRVLRERPAVGLVYADATDIDDDGRPIGFRPAGDPATLGWSNGVNACFLYRRTVFETVGGYDPEWVLVEDWDYWLRVSLHFQLAPLREDLYLYRQHKGSLTATRMSEIIRARTRLMEHWVDRLPWLTPAGRCEMNLKMARASAELGDAAAVRRFNRAAWKAAPAKAALTIGMRRLLGDKGAGALAQSVRRALGRS